MTNESSSMTMKSDNESKLVNTTNSSSTSNNNSIYYNCSSSSGSNKSTTTTTSTTVVATANSATAAANDLPSITLAPFSKIKRESLDSSDHIRTSSSMVTKPISSNSTQVVGPLSSANPSVSAKMGSRRIFTPQFKLQVLESYRNDSDCKGNQRATARKYNIHRRQIQKWLQCESNLRSSVANISANNVKHQFHNITHQMPIVTTSALPSSASSSIHTNSNHHHHHHHAHHNQQYKAINNRLSLDTTRHSVALTSIPTIPQSKAAAAATHQGVSVGDIGAVAPLSSPSPSSTSFLSSSTTVKGLHAPTSPILHSQILSKSETTAMQCNSKGAVIGGPGGGVSLHAPYHHDSMGIHTPPALLTSVPVSVPIITPHPHTHLHVANLKSHYHHLHMEQHHHHHHHHHHPYNQVAHHPPPPPPQPQQQQSSERRLFMPSASLPALPTCSSSSSSSPSSSTMAGSPPPTMTAVALSCTDTMATTPAVALSLVQAEENRIDELRDYQTTTATVVAENRYMNENEYRTHRVGAFEGFHYYMPLHMHPAVAMIAPIDLSLGTKRLDYALSSSFRENNNEYKRVGETTFIETPKREEHDDDNDDSQLNVVDSDFSESSVVDLTLRKRKVLMPTPSDPETVSAEKHTKLSPEEDTDKPHEPAKTFKLFKPYLLGEDSKSSDKETANKICKQKDPIIWSHHTACLSPTISTGSSRGSNFQSPPAPDAYPFPAGSPNFQPTITTTATSSAGFRCPKGSPVSGYESSSSIYSDSASSSDHYGNHSHPHTTSTATTTYRFDLKVHNINGDLPPNKHQLISPTDGCIPLPPTTHHINHVQRWLDQESGIRQSIALYV